MRRMATIIHPGAIGDVLLSIPALRRVRARLIPCDIGLMAQGEISRLLLACGEVQAIFPLEWGAFSGLLAGDGEVRPDLRRRIEQSDLVVCWMADPDHRLESILCHMGARQVISGSPLSEGRVALHQEDRLIELLGQGGEETRESGRLALTKEIIDQGRTLLSNAGTRLDHQPLLVLHPGSGSRHKCSPSSALLPVLDWCRTAHIETVVIEGPADEDAVAELVTRCSPAPLVIRRQSLVSIAGIMAHARLFVGHDSGLTHLAARLHVPTIALFGPTDPRRWAPRGAHVTVLTGALCRCEGWKAVQACREKACLDIPVESIIRACERMLKRRHLPASPAARYLVMSDHLC